VREQVRPRGAAGCVNYTCRQQVPDPEKVDLTEYRGGREQMVTKKKYRDPPRNSTQQRRREKRRNLQSMQKAYI